LNRREACKRDACEHCAGRTTYERIPEGPNDAGNYTHAVRPLPPNAGYYMSAGPVLCRASAIFVREKFEETLRDRRAAAHNISRDEQGAVDCCEEHAKNLPPLSLNRMLECFPPETFLPIPMILFCPACGLQHIDLPKPEIGWANPPHRSHECQGCKFTFRPADIPTAGVAKIETRGKRDSAFVHQAAAGWAYPWNVLPLLHWTICGMNHYFVKGSLDRHLFVAMAKSGRVIKSEGPSEVAVFLGLLRQAEAMDKLIEEENRS
jgi:hypothetical protein